MKKYQYFLGAMILGVVLMSFISTPTSTTSSDGGIHWMTIEEAMAASAKEPRKIMIDVYTKWCGPCKMMSQNTFTDSSVVDYMNKNYYCVKFDAESADSVVFQGKTYKNPGYDPTKTGRNAVHEFSRYLQVSAYPTLIFLDEKGGYIGPVVGYKTPADLELFVKFFATNMHLTVQTQEQWNAYVQGFKATWKK